MKHTIQIIIAAATLSPAPASAENLFSYPGNRPAQLQRQIKAMEDRGGIAFAMLQNEANFAKSEGPLVVPPRKLHGRDIAVYITDAKRIAKRHDVPEALFLALIQQESGWNRRARSSAGAIGLAQLMPGTAMYLKVNPHDPLENLEGGARYLRMQYETFGDWRLALAAYNAGPGAVQKYGGVPPYKETQNYIRRILGG